VPILLPRYVFVGLLLLTSVARAEITEIRRAGNKTFACNRSGLMSSVKDCGAPEWFKYVFTGSISSIKELEDDEKEIQIIPEEVFSGSPPSPLIVRTSQGKCFPPIGVGDHWLFYLREGDPILFDYFGGDSRPISEAAEKLATLRRLKGVGNRGILRGRVLRHAFSDSEPVANAQVIARSSSDDRAEFVTSTNENGVYEFPPLLAGDYDLTVEPVGNFQPDKATARIKNGTCQDLTLAKSPHGKISGRVQWADGTPLAESEMELWDRRSNHYAKTNKEGIFHFDSVPQGKYFLKVTPSTHRSKGAGANVTANGVPVSVIFYPGTPYRYGAVAIALTDDEQKTDIDFFLPFD
jgi:hypothetical protein